MANQTCALLFFGLVRRFDIVLPTIQEHVVRHNPRCDVFAHTYYRLDISNIRNDERRAPINPFDVFQLTKNVMIETLGLFDASRYRHLHPPGRGWVYPTSVENMVLQWNSIQRVFDWATSVQKYARVGLFRLDVVYKTALCLQDTAVVPSFGNSGGVNDRLFMGPTEIARVWATRFPRVAEYQQRNRNVQGVHSETFLKFLLERQPVRFDKSVCFWRIRATGKMMRDCKPGIFE